VSGYPVPARETEVELHFKNSRFIGNVGCAATVEEARGFIAGVRARYPDASHHVYAFAVGYAATVTHGMSDDGEPSGTAGRPTLAVVQGANMGDLVVVTTRYFGGTKLGTGGLVRAYTGTAQEALAATPRTMRVQLCHFQVLLSYPLHATCRKLLEDLGAVIEAEEFTDAVRLVASCPRDDLPAVAAALTEATSGRVAPEPLD
jgi:uncharacterized YigZ family protein